MYSRTQHILLDDPLAAVDSNTAKHLTDRCLNGPLVKGRTVVRRYRIKELGSSDNEPFFQILVSHHIDLLLPSADYIVRILDGRVDAQGTPEELRSHGQLDGLLAMEEAEIKKDEPVTNEEAVEDEVIADVADDGQKPPVKKKQGPGKKLVQGRTSCLNTC